MKVIALYLPQFHEIPENKEWWGEGFTEWVNVKKAKPLYEGHVQPKIPLNHNYYDLSDERVQIWQAELAKKYGIYGFCYYHYWFNGKLLLQKPMENMLKNPKINLPFCICWANEAWTKAWTGEKKVIMPQYYGGRKEWEEHFEYMLPFFKDERYIKCDGKPLFVFYRPELIDCADDMIDCFQELAKNAGFPGLMIAYQHGDMDYYYPDKDKSKYDLDIEFQPLYARADYAIKQDSNRPVYAFVKRFYNKASLLVGRKLGFEIKVRNKRENVLKFDYDKLWECIINKEVVDSKRVPGAFTAWDNTPRHGQRGHVFVGSSPEKFKSYMSALIKKTRDEYHKDMIFVFAWNEWAEGGYLEPDEENGYGYLEAIRDALEENNELPR